MISTAEVARFIVNTNFDGIPASVKEAALMSVVDCIGVTLAGAREPASHILTGYVRNMRACPEAGVIGQGVKTEASLAALVNGTSGHVLDYDDMGWLMSIHPTVPVLPAVLALGQKMRASGRKVLEAYILGVEAEGRVGQATGTAHYDIGWHCTATVGSLGAAAAAGKLLGLNERQLRVCLGIVASMAGGLRDNFGTMVKSLHAGRAAQNGVTAANLAAAGFTASETILESKLGFARVFGGGRDVPSGETLELGKPFVFISPGIQTKPFASCGAAVTGIEAALYLVSHSSIPARDIVEVTLEVDAKSSGIMFYRQPKNGLEAKFSLEYCVARTLISGKPLLRHFTDEAALDPEVASLIGKIKRVEVSSGDKKYKPMANVTVRMRDGSVHSKGFATADSYVVYPLGWEDLRNKYRDCAAVVLSDDHVERSLEMASRLDQLAEVGDLMETITLRDRD